jgi:dTDP-4-amino-4,6-dideoxygalactose transaminase
MFVVCNVIRAFEESVADFSGSRYAVAVDTCTAALFLCCRYLNVKDVVIPAHTFVGVPMAVFHAGGRITFDHREWHGAYDLRPYPIWDSACRFQRGMYKAGSLWCLSFQYRKHVPIGRGGMILTDDAEACAWLRKARFFGRCEKPIDAAHPEFIGWSMYMEPERAARGLSLLSGIADSMPDLSFAYPDLSEMDVFKKQVG